MLVLQVGAHTITLTYSDLHRARLEFFQSLLAPFGAKWSTLESRVNADLNDGAAYTVGIAQFDCPDQDAMQAALEGIGSRIVFLIDWNRARKRLQAFVDKDDAIAVLAEAARLDIGHRAWLQATGYHVKALEIARSLGADSGADDNDAFLGATWRVLQAERQCDGLLRDARRVILRQLRDAASLMLANDLAMALESASDCLLTAGYALRDVAFDKTGAR